MRATAGSPPEKGIPMLRKPLRVGRYPHAEAQFGAFVCGFDKFGGELRFGRDEHDTRGDDAIGWPTFGCDLCGLPQRDIAHLGGGQKDIDVEIERVYEGNQGSTGGNHLTREHVALEHPPRDRAQHLGVGQLAVDDVELRFGRVDLRGSKCHPFLCEVERGLGVDPRGTGTVELICRGEFLLP